MNSKFFFFIFSSFVSYTTFSQVKVGQNPDVINPSAILHVESSNKGVLFPNVALTSSTDQTTIASPATGLMVYNTGTAGLSPAGYYFWNGTQWATFRLSNQFGQGSGSPEFFNFRIITGNYTPSNPYTVTDNDHVLILRYSSSSTGSSLFRSASIPFLNPEATLILPDPTTCPGRVLRLINDSHRIYIGGKGVFTNYPMFSYTPDVLYTTPPSTLDYTVQASINGAQWIIMSDGERWISLNVVII